MYTTIRAIAIMLVLCFASLTLRAGSRVQDSHNAAEAKGSVTGRVTLDGKPAQGILVNLNKYDPNPQKMLEQILQRAPGLRAITDEEGMFRFNDVPVGLYEASPFAPALITPPDSNSSERSHVITVSEGKPVEGVNFALSRGGVITGQVTDSEGNPAIRETISLSGADDNATTALWRSQNLSMMMTDDRGIYRVYGLPPGRYIVSVGGTSSNLADLGSKQSRIPRTYHPGSGDRAKAKVVEVTAGGEAGGIDIKIPAGAKGLQASGHIIDEAGKPVPNVMVTYSPADQAGGTVPFSGGYTASSAKGEFQFDNIQPGKYKVTAQVISQTTEFYADTLTIEVKKENLTGLEIKLRRGSTISGMATIEGTNDPETIAKLSQTFLGASVSAAQPDTARLDAISKGADLTAPGFTVGQISADGSFRISGVKPGKATITTFGLTGPSDFKLSRVEIGGVEVSNGIDIKAGDNITGVRLVFALVTGVIKGKVVISGGKLPDGTYIKVRVYRSGTDVAASDDWDDDVEVDANGNFFVGKLEAGSYDIEVSAERINDDSDGTPKLGSTKQTVIVTTNAPAEAIITLEIKKTDKR